MEDQENEEGMSNKKYIVAVILSGIFGVIGIHHFYVQRWLMGILDLGLFVISVYLFINEQYVIGGIVAGIDFIHTVIVTYLLLVGQYKDGDGNLITYPGQKI